MHQCKPSETITRGVRVSATPRYMPDESDPDHNRFLFVYRIRITNETEEPVQLISRHWLIIDADGQREEVQGRGVVGETPILAPLRSPDGGDPDTDDPLEPSNSYEYVSACPLTTPWGTMEGVYHMRGIDGEMFDVQIGRFYLVAPQLEMTGV